MAWWNKENDFDATQDIDPNKGYTNWEMEQLADQLLKNDSKRELCRKCGEYGELTGEIESMPQADEDGNAQSDAEGNVLYIDFPELVCANGHRWYQGEGKSRGIGGKDPILFENHIQDRRRREIYCAIGTPDPSIQKGIYNRQHPQGRKVNTKEQRQKHGASWYR